MLYPAELRARVRPRSELAFPGALRKPLGLRKARGAAGRRCGQSRSDPCYRTMAELADPRPRLLAAAAGMMIMLSAGAPGASEPVRLEGPLPVAEVLAGDLVRLDDGRAVRLAGIRVPAESAGERAAPGLAEQARAALRELLDGRGAPARSRRARRPTA
jgi:hypothetical protein